MLRMLKDRVSDYNPNNFLNELFEASKLFGILEAKVIGYQFNSILVPMFRIKEVTSSMFIEGTQVTMTEAIESDLLPPHDRKEQPLREYNRLRRAIAYGTDYLRTSGFTDELICTLHLILIGDDVSNGAAGHYKQHDNVIVNSLGKVVFTPPSHIETGRYMRELLAYMNDTVDAINPLIKAAIIHSQFESIHPFEDGNGRIGRLLVSLYLYKAGVINFPFFYISEAIAQDKVIYYQMLTNSRNNSYDAWIQYFIKKCIVQANSLISYIDRMDRLYQKTKIEVQDCVNSPRFDKIIECIFTQPILTAAYLSEQLSVTNGQAVRYLNKLEERKILVGDDRKRGRKYYFVELLELSQNH